MIMWISANWINLLLIAVIALIIGLLIRSMIRDRKAGKSPCGGNCACCGACTGCSACSSKCATGKPIAKT
ncbi:MAG: FeoB-associated Cys-rich membrane protein [Candidatus Limivicinus sp.]